MEKVASLAEAAGLVKDGSRLALGGFAISRNAIAAVAELIRQGRRDLHLTQVIGGMETDLLVGSGCVSHLVYSGGSLDRFGPLHSVNRAIASGSVVAEEYSTLSLTLRLLAGGLGLPFIPTRSLLGSQLLDSLVDAGGAIMTTDPFTGAPVLALAPIRPEVAIVHANVCDDVGNAVIEGPTWSMRETALASSKVIVTAERVVPAGSLDPEDVTIPGMAVTAVVQAPAGGRPTAVFGEYDYDASFFTEHVAASRQGGDTFASYVTERIVEVNKS